MYDAQFLRHQLLPCQSFVDAWEAVDFEFLSRCYRQETPGKHAERSPEMSQNQVSLHKHVYIHTAR